MDNIKTTFTLNGTTYIETKTGYCFMDTGKVNKKGDPIGVRISRGSFDTAFDTYLRLKMEDDEKWEKEVTDARDNAKAEREAEDRAVEAEFNKTLTKMNKEQNEKNEFTNISKEDVKKEMKKTPTRKEVNEAVGRAIDKLMKEEDSKKARKSKDIAYEYRVAGGTSLTLTSKQVDFIHHIPDTCFYETGLDSTPWCDVLADEIGGQFAGKPMTVGAMISTLREKELIYVGVAKVNGRKAKFFGFTDLGKEIAKELGLN